MITQQTEEPVNTLLTPTSKVVLSLDGGGMRGLAVARILEEIEKQTGKPIHKLFNVVVGTSTGGLLSVLLTIPTSKTGTIMSAKEILELYKAKARYIFEDRWVRKIFFLYPIDVLRNSRFDQSGLMDVIKELYAPEDLYSLANAHPDLHVGLCCSDRKNRKSILLNSYRARQDRHDWRHATHLLYTVLATSSAPTYFNPIGLTKHDKLPADGEEAIDKTTFQVRRREMKRLRHEAKTLRNVRKDHAVYAVQKQCLIEPGRARRLSVDWYDPVTEEKPTTYARAKVILEDGGVTKNNPSKLGLTFAKKLILQEGGGHHRDIMNNIRLVSIGTGSKYFIRGREIDPSEYKDIFGEPQGKDKTWAITWPFRKSWELIKKACTWIFEGSGYGLCGVLNRWTADPFDLDQNSWNSHVKMLDQFNDAGVSDNYIRAQYHMDAEYIDDMSKHEESTMIALINSAEKYIYQNWDDEKKCRIDDELSCEFVKLLRLIDPNYKEEVKVKVAKEGEITAATLDEHEVLITTIDNLKLKSE